jgi:hypothetical protein
MTGKCIEGTQRDEEGPPVVAGETEDQTYDIVESIPKAKNIEPGVYRCAINRGECQSDF